MPIGFTMPEGAHEGEFAMPKIAPPPGLFIDGGCETPKGSFTFQPSADTPSTGVPTPSTGTASLPATPLLADGKDANALLLNHLSGLFPDLPAETNNWNYNPFLQQEELGKSALADSGIPAGWMNDPAAMAAAAALWMGTENGFPVPMGGLPVDDTTPPGSLANGHSGSVPWSWEARPKLRDLRALPSRGLGLHYNHGQFGVVSLPDARPPTGPAATVVRPAEKYGVPGFGGLAGGSALPEVSWQVKDWVATRTLRNPSEDSWMVTETVPLAKTVEASQEEWERRFCQREKQVMVGKGTRGYQQYVAMIPKEKRSARDPSTPRVAEQCSKRAFDGRLKQWRILLHAFSPRGSPENSPRTSTRESTAGGEEEKTPDMPKAFLPKAWDGKNAKARVALDRANVPSHLEKALENVFCNERDGVQNYFGRQEFEFELAKRAHAFLSAEKSVTFGPALQAVSSLLEELRKTNNSYC